MIPDTSHLFRQPKLAFCLKEEREGRARAEARQSRADTGRKIRGWGGDERREPGKEVSPADGCWVGTVEEEGEAGGRCCNWIKRGGRGVNRQNQDKEK